MEVEVSVTEDARGWEATPAPVPDGVLRPAGEGLWVVEHLDGGRQEWKCLIVQAKTRP